MFKTVLNVSILFSKMLRIISSRGRINTVSLHGTVLGKYCLFILSEFIRYRIYEYTVFRNKYVGIVG